jgi:hypothetical protein
MIARGAFFQPTQAIEASIYILIPFTIFPYIAELK